MAVASAALLLLAPTPAITFDWFCRSYSLKHHAEDADPSYFGGLLSCSIWQDQPQTTVNVLMIFNMCCLFWVLSLVQNSTWLIDPYWTIIPCMIEAYYASHPAAAGTSRSTAAAALIAVWSLRLSHSYFRREGWQLGVREDWRFADMRQKFGKHWWWMSFFLAYVSQYIMLVGLTLPLHSASFSTTPWHWLWDDAAVVMCITGLITAYVSDTSLHEFVTANTKRQTTGQPKQMLLQTGLWRYSRHPNHVGEQLFWWGISLFGVSSHAYWTLLGPLVNTICMVQVTRLVETKMIEQPHRAAAYRRYQQTTPMWLPGFAALTKQF
ncbi:hypothetical protein WJX77_011017 [Trebouxia sp. C0004]